MGHDMSRRLAIGAIVSAAMAGGRAASLAAQNVLEAPLRQFRVIRDDPALDRLIAPDARLETIHTFPQLRGEGPLWHRGKLWFSELRTGQIIEVGLDGTTRIVAENAGGALDPAIPTLQGPNGLASWRDGGVLVCRHGARNIAILKRDGSFETLIPDFQGKRFNSPNDIIAGRDGSVWFTDPPLGLPGHPWARPANPDAPPPGQPPALDQQIPFAGVFRFRNGQLSAVITDMPAPNGLALSRDGRTLYVNNAMPEMYVRAYAVAVDGTLSNGREIFRLPSGQPQGLGVPDGMKLDARGNLWMSGPRGLYVISPEGKLLGRIELPQRSTNLAFGEDSRSLFIVSNPHILRIRTRVKGLISPFAQPGWTSKP